jgi:hypothetical protein
MAAYRLAETPPDAGGEPVTPSRIGTGETLMVSFPWRFGHAPHLSLGEAPVAHGSHILHRLSSDRGSSGAAMFQRDGDAFAFVGMHLGGDDLKDAIVGGGGGNANIALPGPGVLNAFIGNARSAFG